MSNPVLEAVNAFMDAVGASMASMRTEITELRAALALQTRAVETVPGTAGKDGRDGKDGVDGKDGSAGKDGERGADGIATLADLDARIEARFGELQVRTLADSYRDVFRDGEAYKRGETVTWGGSLWLAKVETRSKPGENTDWRLVVKRGADGKK